MHWKTAVKTKISKNSRIKQDQSIKIGNTYFNKMNNKQIKNEFISRKFVKPYVHKYWEEKTNSTVNWDSVYHILNSVVPDNKIKQFRFKLIHKIIPTNENLLTWKILNSNKCLHCDEKDTLQHYFTTCPYVTPFWTELSSAFKQIGIQKSMQSIN